ncbi:hypothetical protein [Amorphus orientalis]|uniref:ElaB/YqjD/DUF883 family membrane-anchored ribosome-binding protein n=1 Tax=Amorphus orientalis TaxID=649198 RepID=A0AAE3VQZ1_9HYPH|nr:hypothetical protein [Amorphus orientalis]MDQ0317109.1 ElaB/YqjD/DUF883 family membrane-anchored ribosome-binding protein [Amorphus orientalis]
MAEPQAKAAEQSAKKTTDDISRDLDALRGDLSKLADTVRTLLGEEADTVRTRLNDRADRMAQQGKAYRDAAVDEFRSYEHEAEAAIHRNPFTAVLVALGLGLFLGFLSRR